MEFAPEKYALPDLEHPENPQHLANMWRNNAGEKVEVAVQLKPIQMKTIGMCKQPQYQMGVIGCDFTESIIAGEVIFGLEMSKQCTILT
jgi:hypothetical protein